MWSPRRPRRPGNRWAWWGRRSRTGESVPLHLLQGEPQPEDGRVEQPQVLITQRVRLGDLHEERERGFHLGGRRLAVEPPLVPAATLAQSPLFLILHPLLRIAAALRRGAAIGELAAVELRSGHRPLPTP